MTRVLTSGILAACVCAALGAAAQQQPTFRGTGDAVRVFVTVTDRDGRLVTTLEQKDFEVRDEGKPQPITLFDNTPQPIRLIVMLDVSGSMEGNLPLLRAAAEQLFARLRPDDVARVGTFGHEVTISPTFTRDPASCGRRCRARSRPMRRRRSGARSTRRWTPSATAATSAPVILVLSDGKDSGPIGFRAALRQPGRGHRPRARRGRDGLRDRHAQPRPAADAAGHRSGRPAGGADGRPARIPASRASRRRPAAATRRFASGRISAPRSRRSPTSCTASICSASRRRSATARCTTSTCASRQRGLKPRARKSYVAPKSTS